jgi:hypothetical protein
MNGWRVLLEKIRMQRHVYSESPTPGLYVTSWIEISTEMLTIIRMQSVLRIDSPNLEWLVLLNISHNARSCGVQDFWE